MSQIAVLSAALMVVLVAAGCTYLGLAPPDADPSLDVPTELSDYELGVEYPLRVGTHCGFQATSIGGQRWVPVARTPRQDNNLGFNATDGTVVLTSAEAGDVDGLERSCRAAAAVG